MTASAVYLSVVVALYIAALVGLAITPPRKRPKPDAPRVGCDCLVCASQRRPTFRTIRPRPPKSKWHFIVADSDAQALEYLHILVLGTSNV